MAFAGQNVLHAWQPMHPEPMKYILVPLMVAVWVGLISADFAEAIEFETFSSKGAAIAAELAIMNFLLVKFILPSVISLFPPKYVNNKAM